ncbi:Gfo/Idh/MocA family protein [Acuticoccus sp.]|uniref:Gfo/Idh/MocA family protein n=1 Tax=Acuticoccus sp. TaxID=1904378 RepID=UPI003B52D21D
MLTVALIGAGYFARFHREAWTREPRARLVAICDTDAARAQAAADEVGATAYTDAASMLAAEQPDLVDIATPPHTHRDLVGLTVSHGIPTICQKAFCRSLEEAHGAVAVAREAGVPLVVHENFRFQPWHREVRRLLGEDAVGRLYQVTFRMRPGDGQGARAYLDRQPYFQSMERFLVHETAIHFVDTFRFLLGPPRAVWADLRRLNPAIAGEDAGLIMFDHGDVRAVFDGNRLADHTAANRRLTMGEMLVEGERGTIRLDGDGRLHRREFGANEEHAHAYAWEDRDFAGGSVAALQAHVVAHLLDGAPLENAGADYLANLEVEEAIYASAASGRRIALG